MSVGRNALLVTGGTVVGQITQLATLPLISRFADPAAFGTYSVIALLLQQRTPEIGIRLALGADPARVARVVLRSGVALALVAGVIGSVLALAVLKLLASQLYGVDAGDWPLYALGVGATVLTALAASALPARRAARVAPVEALRHD